MTKIQARSLCKMPAQLPTNSACTLGLDGEVFDVSHNPELAGVIPEQVIVDWSALLSQVLTSFAHLACGHAHGVGRLMTMQN